MPTKALTLACLCLTSIWFAGCARSVERAPVAAPRLDPPPTALVEPCARPAPLPDRAMTRAEAAKGWARDRINLATCADRHSALSTFIADRDGRLTP